MPRGLPQINIIFRTKGVTAIARSERGIVACILRDDTAGGERLNVYDSIIDVDFTHYTARNFEYLKLIYEGRPNRVIVIKEPTTTASYNEALRTLRDLRWNYLTIPGIASQDVMMISTWIKEEREESRKTFKAVLPNYPADHEGIINFTTTNIKTVSELTFSASEYCARIAGLLAGLPLSRSSTYYVLNDIVSADTPIDPNERINKGELIIIFDSEKFKIGRGVNSFVSFTTEKGEDLGKIKIIEGCDLYQDDISSTFEDFYIGKIRNDYDSKQMFVAAINSYHRGLQGDVLDASYNNVACIDINAQREYLESRGISTKDMTELEIAMANTGSKVLVSSKVKFVDAMEDLTMIVNM